MNFLRWHIISASAYCLHESKVGEWDWSSVWDTPREGRFCGKGTTGNCIIFPLRKKLTEHFYYLINLVKSMLKKNHNIFKRENKIILIKNENTKNKHPYKKILGLNLKKKNKRKKEKPRNTAWISRNISQYWRHNEALPHQNQTVVLSCSLHCFFSRNFLN